VEQIKKKFNKLSIYSLVFTILSLFLYFIIIPSSPTGKNYSLAFTLFAYSLPVAGLILALLSFVNIIRKKEEGALFSITSVLLLVFIYVFAFH